MKYIICEEPFKMLIKEMNLPEIKQGEALLKIKKVGICGTDIHAYEGTQPFFKYPRILGHELAAEYAGGAIAGLDIGDKVTVMPYFSCGTCIACRSLKPNCCETIAVFGVHTDGGLCEYVKVPQEYVINGQGLDYDQLVLVEPFAIAAHGVARAGINSNDTVLIMGIGPIGAGLIEFARIAGAKKIIALDINDFRLEYAEKVQGIDAVINPTNEDVTEALKRITNGDMPNVIIDATGNRKVMNDAFNYLSHGGRYVLVGLQKEMLTFSHPEFHKREATLMSSRNATGADFDLVINCLKAGKLNISKYITHRLKFSNINSEFSTVLDASQNIVKAVVEFD